MNQTERDTTNSQSTHANYLLLKQQLNYPFSIVRISNSMSLFTIILMVIASNKWQRYIRLLIFNFGMTNRVGNFQIGSFECVEYEYEIKFGYHLQLVFYILYE